MNEVCKPQLIALEHTDPTRDWLEKSRSISNPYSCLFIANLNCMKLS